MKNYIIYCLLVFSGMISCVKEEPEPSIPLETEQTLFLYMPWSTNLTSYFEQNIRDFESAIAGNILKNNRLIVFFSSSATEASLFELTYEKGKNVRTTLKEYTNPSVTTASGITSILNDLVSFAPANRYALIVSSHGMGWLPVPASRFRASGGDFEKDYWAYDGVPLTRYFGGTTPDVQTPVTTLAEAIAAAGIKMEYILFDDCYMSTIEVAYDLKEVTDYLIASPTEVIADGFPYHTIGKYLVGNFSLQGICEGFYDYYSNHKYPYGTIAVTVTAELDHLAALMKTINQHFSFDVSLLNSLQPMDGYSPVIFFDFGHYVRHICADAAWMNQLENQLERTIPTKWRFHTRSYYSMISGEVEINTFTGSTISDPSENLKATAKTETAWYKATH